MMCNTLRLSLLALGLVALGALSAQAVPTVYFDRDDNSGFMTSFPLSQAQYNLFTASLASFGVDTVDTALGFNPSLSFGATGITGTANGTLATAAPGFSIGAQALLETDAAIASPALNTVFTFNQYITGFGLFVIQSGDGANNNPTTFRLTNTGANTFVDVPVQVGPGWGQSNVFFFGVTDTAPFNEVSLIETGDLGDGMLYDSIVAGNLTVPEPSSLALLALGACALRFATRKRRG